MKSRYSIRRASVTDLPAIYVGELDYIQQVEPEQESNWRKGLRFHLKQWIDDLDRMFIAECANAHAGYCLWEVHGDSAVLASIYVTPSQRGNGLGQQLLARFIDDAHAHGFGKLTLSVKPDNLARSLYERAGFIYTHDEHGYCKYVHPMAGVRTSAANPPDSKD